MQRHSLSAFITAGLLFAATSLQAAESRNVRSITLAECVRLALEHNLSIRISRFNPELARLDLRAAYANYEPELFASAIRNGGTAVPRYNPDINQIVPGAQVDTDTLAAGLRGILPSGLNYTLQGQMSDSGGTQYITLTNRNIFALPVEQADGSLSISLSQPLLRNFFVNAPQLAIDLGKNALGAQEQAMLHQVIATVTATEIAYYDLVTATENVRTQEKALEWAQRQVSDFKKKVEVGAMAPLDAQQAEAQAASYHATLLGAQNGQSVAENTLKNLLTGEFAEWQKLMLAPAEQKLNALPRVLSVSDSWLNGLTRRPDLQQARIELDRLGIQLKYQKNQLLPQLDLVGSYRAIGVGNEYPSAVDSTLKRDGDGFAVGAQFSIPLGNGEARAARKRVLLQQEQALLRLKALEQSILVEIDNAVNVARTDLERVAATRKAREYWEAALDAEQKKLENGKSTSFEVLRVQRDLVSAQLAEMQALAEYNKALAYLSESEASTLERHAITVETRR